MAFTSEINTWTCLDVLDTSFFSIRMVEYMHVYLTRFKLFLAFIPAILFGPIVDD